MGLYKKIRLKYQIRICKKIWLKYHIRKLEKFLLVEGMREAAKRRKNIQIGLECKAIINEDIFENIYLPQNSKGQIDISPILGLGAENNLGEARKYIIYQKILKRLEFISDRKQESE